MDNISCGIALGTAVLGGVMSLVHGLEGMISESAVDVAFSRCLAYNRSRGSSLFGRQLPGDAWSHFS